MSGGSFDYAYSRIERFAESLRNRLDAEANAISGNGDYVQEWETPTYRQLEHIVQLAMITGSLMREVEWLYSSDIGEELFLQHVAAIAGSQKMVSLE